MVYTRFPIFAMDILLELKVITVLMENRAEKENSI
jgi:hypothetical protein